MGNPSYVARLGKAPDSLETTAVLLSLRLRCPAEAPSRSPASLLFGECPVLGERWKDGPSSEIGVGEEVLHRSRSKRSFTPGSCHCARHHGAGTQHSGAEGPVDPDQ